MNNHLWYTVFVVVAATQMIVNGNNHNNHNNYNHLQNTIDLVLLQIVAKITNGCSSNSSNHLWCTVVVAVTICNHFWYRNNHKNHNHLQNTIDLVVLQITATTCKCLLLFLWQPFAVESNQLCFANGCGCCSCCCIVVVVAIL